MSTEQTYIIAEIGSNHNGDITLAKELIDSAAAAGVDAVKFQTFKAKEHYSKYSPGFGYLEKKNTYSLIESLEIDRSWHEILFDYARVKGVSFLSSACDSEAVQELGRLGMEMFKVASFDITDLSLIREMAQWGRTMILSTGMASWTDIERAVVTCREVNNNDIVLLQCTSLYPAPPRLANLRAMETMGRAFGVRTGYSDHTLGTHVCVAAVAAGARMIEKHITIDRGMEGPDHKFAIESDELRALVSEIRDVESAMGDGGKFGPHMEEMEMYEKGRRSLHAKRDIIRGQTIEEEDIYVKRPGYGITPALRNIIVGRVAKQDIPEDKWITWDDI